MAFERRETQQDIASWTMRCSTYSRLAKLSLVCPKASACETERELSLLRSLNGQVRYDLLKRRSVDLNLDREVIIDRAKGTVEK